jgi:glyceraldehyde 3-phosphate dehydrogenase
MTVKVAINGFGRIGRNILRAIVESGRTDIEVVAVNDLGPVETNAHLVRYDSVHGRFPGTVTVDGDSIDVGRGPIRVTAIRDPRELPWDGVDIVDGMHRAVHRPRQGGDASRERFEAGADLGPRGGRGQDDRLWREPCQPDRRRHWSCRTRPARRTAWPRSPRSSTTRSASTRGFMTTIHSYTGDQPTLDTMHKDLYRARAAAMSMIPTSTGAAKAVGLVLPELAGRLDGVAIRVPTPNVSVVDLVFETSRATSTDEINAAIRAAANGPIRCAGLYRREPGLDGFQPRPAFLGLPHRSDQGDGRPHLVRVLSWYDNEWGFSNRMARHRGGDGRADLRHAAPDPGHAPNRAGWRGGRCAPIRTGC